MTCGAGIQSRAVGCALSDGMYGRENDCDPYTKPLVERPCLMNDCPGSLTAIDTSTPVSGTDGTRTESKHSYWRVGAWSKVRQLPLLTY